MITIHSNGSKWAGESPDTIDRLLEVLAAETLDPRFEEYGNFYIVNKPITTTSGVHFFGNFMTVSHVFNIDTDDQPTIDALTAAIRANQATAEYKRYRAELRKAPTAPRGAGR